MSEVVSQANRRTGMQARKAMFVLTLVFGINFVLSFLLLFTPYVAYLLFHKEVYARTRYYGLDPREWWPFSWEGFGHFLYDVSFVVWIFAACAALPLLVVQTTLLSRTWRGLSNGVRSFHVTILGLSALLSLFMVTIGRTILTWLVD